MKNRYKQVQCFPGERITFGVRGEEGKFTETILGFQDSLILFRNYKLPVSRIDKMYVDEKNPGWFILKYKHERIFLYCGCGIIGLDLLNNAKVPPEILTSGSILIVAGLAAKKIVKDHIKISAERRLYIIND